MAEDRDPPALTPANANRWYVLMTLYGEQTGEEIDRELHERNRAAWNAWSGQGMGDEEREAAAKSSYVPVAELAAWPEMKSEVEQRHKAEMLLRNGEDFVYPGLPSVNAPLNLQRLRFDHAVAMWSMVVATNAYFGNATFTKALWFTYATFSNAAHFNAATISGDATFIGAFFSKTAEFPGAKFCGEVDFSSATFKGDALFICTAFGGTARFTKAIFHGHTKFVHARVGGDAFFRSATFKGHFWCKSVAFSGSVHFNHAIFAAAGQDKVVQITDCQFLNPASFRDANFHSLYPDFSGTILHEKTTFTADDTHWPKTVSDPLAAIASCAVIRHNLGKQGLPEAEHFFYRREMAFGKEIGGFWDKLPFRLYDWLSEYGHSIERPFWWLIWLWLVPGLVFAAKGVTGVALADLGVLGRGLALSFADMFSFLGLQRAFFEADLGGMGWALQVLAGFQTVMGFVFLFLLGLGLRIRFRLR